MSTYADLSRPPLRQEELRRALLRPGALWTRLRVASAVASTNAELVADARAGAPEGAVLVAELQTAGRGRRGRQWQSPAQAGLTFSVLLRPATPVTERGWPPVTPSRYGWLPLLAGVALADVARRLGRLDASLKWPNDLLVTLPQNVGAARKCAGVLAEATPGGPDGAGGTGGVAVVIGVGLNVSTRADELPHEGATSLALAGSACVDRDPLLRAVLREFAAGYADWRAAGGDPEKSELRADYLACCDTLGRQVRAHLPSGEDIVGEAVDIDAEGRLILSRHTSGSVGGGHGDAGGPVGGRRGDAGEKGGRIAIAAGDIVHVR